MCNSNSQSEKTIKLRNVSGINKLPVSSCHDCVRDFIAVISNPLPNHRDTKPSIKLFPKEKTRKMLSAMRGVLAVDMGPWHFVLVIVFPYLVIHLVTKGRFFPRKFSFLF